MKPPYRVPTMAEIAALEWNGFTAESTFSGCGGSSLGYRLAGFRMAWASEFIEAARDTYRANASPATVLDGRDIREVTAAEIVAASGIGVGELDLFDGSPPCASFSTAGKRQAGWGKVKKYSDGAQRTDDLFFEYARLIRELQPRTFVAENVSGLVKGAAKGYFLQILAALRDGYRVEARLLNAAWLGVPQARQRLIFVGVRNDLGLPPVFPKPLPYRYSIREAVERADGPVTTDPETGQDITIGRFAIGAEWHRTRPGKKSEKYLNLVRPDPAAPIPTITAAGGNLTTASVTHWAECRKLTLAELRRVCGFPDDFILAGTYAQRWERLGRAVPPVMMAAIAGAVRDQILVPLREKGTI